jgi:anti-sigma-K factor RskA
MTTGGEHDELKEQAALYVLGALTAADRARFEAHLATCSDCAAEAHLFASVPDALGLAVPQVSPSAALRERVLRSVGGLREDRLDSKAVRLETDQSARKQARFEREGAGRAPWMAVAASLMLAAGSGLYAWQLRGRIADLEIRLSDAIAQAADNDRQIAQAKVDVADAEARLAVLVAPDVTQVDMTGQPPAPGASGRAYWSRSRGLMFTASDLPVPPAGQAYQLWILAANRPPISNRWMLRPDAAGRAAALFETPADVPPPTGVAVSLEPDAGVPAPTGALYLVGLINQL